MYTPAGWVQVASLNPTVSGGSVTTSGGQTIHTFTTSGTLSIQGGSGITVSYLTVGGGGGGPGNSGGQVGGGGGGAGGVVYRTGLTLNPGSYAATVGGGGSGGPVGNNKGSSGTDSQFGPNIAEGGGHELILATQVLVVLEQVVGDQHIQLHKPGAPMELQIQEPLTKQLQHHP